MRFAILMQRSAYARLSPSSSCPHLKLLPLPLPAIYFSKGTGIIDHAEEQQRGTVHDFHSLLCYRAHERTVEQLPFRRFHACRKFASFIDYILHYRILKQAIHFRVYITGIFVDRLLEFFRAFLNGIHISLKSENCQSPAIFPACLPVSPR